MRLVTVFFLASTLPILSGCEQAMSKREVNADKLNQGAVASNAGPRPQAAPDRAEFSAIGQGQSAQQAGQRQQPQTVSLDHVSAIKEAEATIDRKIIRNAELAIDLDSPLDAQRRIGSIAESHGGFVVTSESKHSDSANQSLPSVAITMIVRVPSAQFRSTMEEIRAVGGRIKQDKTSSQDVTEEFIDLDARIRAKKALEVQFLEIMKQARKVSEALEVQSQLSEVRTEIERLEGRRRFLDNQSSLSTITVTLQTPLPVVAATTYGFLHSFKEAFGDSIDVGTAIILGLIRLTAILIPILVLIVLPFGWLLRACIRRYGWFKRPQPIPQPQ